MEIFGQFGGIVNIKFAAEIPEQNIPRSGRLQIT